MSARTLIGTLILALVATPALAANVYLASYENELLRYVGGTTQSYTVPDDIFGLQYDQAVNTVYAVGRYNPVDGYGTIYTVQNPTSGALSLSPYSRTAQHFGCITKIGGLFYGFNDAGLWTIDLSDPANPVETLVGSHGVISTGGAAYDAATGRLYMVSYDTDLLYDVDEITGAATPIGSVGINLGSHGLEWWNGQLYLAAQNWTSGQYEIGTLDTATGAYTRSFDLPRPAAWAATSLAVLVPEPASLVLIAGLALVSLRRR